MDSAAHGSAGLGTVVGMESRVRRSLVVVGLLAAAAIVMGVALWRVPAGSPAAVVPVSAAAPSADEEVALRVLRAWDRARAQAWAHGSTSQLRRLYPRGSAAAAEDVARLEAYAARGLVVEGMRMQILSADVTRLGPGRLQVVVTDRLTGAEVVARADPSMRVPLPRDLATTWTVVLTQAGRRWLVAGVS